MRQKMKSCDRYYVTGTRTIIDNIVGWYLLLFMLKYMYRISPS